MGFFNVLDRALLQPGQSEDISKVLENFDAIAAVLNGGIDDTNFAGGLIFDPQKLQQRGATVGQLLTWDGAKWNPVTPVVVPTWLATPAMPAATAALTANTAYLFPIAVTTTTPIAVINFGVGTQSGNMDVGVYYSDDNLTFTRLASNGGFVTPAAGAAGKAVPATITPVIGRKWYLAIAADNAVATFTQNSSAIAGGIRQDSFKKAASYPLPASLSGTTSATQATVYLYATL